MIERQARRVIRGWQGLFEYTGLRRTQLQTMVAEGRFPAPVRLGPRAIGWYENDIAKYQDKLSRKQHEDA
jgi:prophage regulatory protein